MSGTLAYLDLPDYPRRLAYRQWGEGHANQLLCVHGLTRNGLDFEPLAKSLSRHWHVVAPDMAGRGSSDWLVDPVGYNYGTYLADIGALLVHLGWYSFSWFGTSMGGILGMMMAAGYMPVIDRLVLNDVGAFIPAEGLKRIFRYAGALSDFATRAEAEAAVRRNGESFGIVTVEEWNHFLDVSLVEVEGRWRYRCDPAILNALRDMPGGFEATQDVDLEAFWQAVRCPVLLIRGENSDIFPAPVAEAMADRADGAVSLVTVPHSGHAPHLYSHAQIDPIKAWLNSH